MSKAVPKVGDTIYVEQAYEDESGAYHDEYAEVLEIDDQGFMKLSFDDPKVTEFLTGADYYVNDYEPEPGVRQSHLTKV